MKLKSLMKKADVKCPECGAFGLDIQKKGLRKSKRRELQKYYCKLCGKYFVNKKMLRKSYSTNVILNAISFYNKGMTFVDASKKVNKKFGVKTSPELIHTWMKEFSDVCTFQRMRKKIKQGRKSGFSNPVFAQLVEHKQPYLYKYHKLKMDMFLTGYYVGLRNYLVDVVEICPHELFLKDNVRSSQIKINREVIGEVMSGFGKDGGKEEKIEIMIEKKRNYACKLAELALKMARTNKQRHEIIQDFMLVNDTATLAVEVPIWLAREEVRKINSEFCVFPEFEKGNEITGHIDIVQARYGLIYVLDYKPEAEKMNIASVISQLFTYALALSVRTDVWLRNFRCAWFDENGYYEFNPNDIVLARISAKFSGQIPEHYVKKYVLNEKARSYFTGSEFHVERMKKEKRKAERLEGLKEKWNRQEKEKRAERRKAWRKFKVGVGEKSGGEETEGIVIKKDKNGRMIGVKK